MADNDWIMNLRRIVLQAIEAENPCDILPGIVTKNAPLEIQIDQRNILNAEQILVPEAMTDHIQEMVIPGIGTVRATIKNALKAGDKVLLIQERGAQHYLVVDRWQKGG